MRLAAALFAAGAAAAGDAARPAGVDLRRARTRVPRAGLRAPTFAGASRALNGALRAGGAPLRDCTRWSVPELNELLRTLLAARSAELGRVYAGRDDNRVLRYGGEHGEPEEQWATELAALRRRPDLAAAARDGKCHEAVMLWAHHLTAAARASAGVAELPSLPERRHFKEEDRPAGARGGGDAAVVVSRYLDNVGCWICHGDPYAPTPERKWPADAPQWPPVQVPVFRNQWTADMWGWEKNARFPNGINVTGTWHYDFVNNRVRQDYTGTPTGTTLKTNTTLFWFAEPAPADDMQGTFKRGRFYAVVRPNPDNMTTVICSWLDYQNMMILRPDAFAEVLLNVGGTGSDYGAQYVTREEIDGRWADFWRFPFTDPMDHKCDGNFTLWYDIEEMRPVKDFGPNDCAGGDAASHWSNFRYGTPDPGLFSVFDFTDSDSGGICVPDTPPSGNEPHSALPAEAAAIVDFALRRFGGHHLRSMLR